MFSRVLVLLVLVGLALVLGGVDAGEKYPTTEQRRLFAGNTADRARADASKFNQDTTKSLEQKPSREPQQSSTNSKVVSKSRQLICIARKPNQVPAFIGLTVNTKRPRFMGKPLIRLSKPKDQVLKDYSGQHVGILPDFDAEFEISLRRETFRSFNKVFNDHCFYFADLYGLNVQVAFLIDTRTNQLTKTCPSSQTDDDSNYITIICDIHNTDIDI